MAPPAALRGLLRRRLSPTMARLVGVVFVLQLVSSAATILVLRGQMLDVVREDRIRQVVDVRDDLLATYYDGGRPALVDAVATRRGSAADPTVFIALSGGGGEAVTSNIDSVPDIPPQGGPQSVMVDRSGGLPDIDGMALAGFLPDGSRLTVGVMTGSDRRLDLVFAAAIGLTTALAVLLALLSALLLGVVISRRTHDLAATAAELASGNFGARVRADESGDGFDHLRAQLNLMAERIGELVTQLSSVSGTLAHDLRSPVARLSAAIDTALMRTDEPSAVEALQAAKTDAEGLRAMLETALEISRLEGGAIEDRRARLDLSTVAEDLIDLYEPLAEQSGIRLEARLDAVIVEADRELVSRALANLIDNALKYGGRHIMVTTRAVPGGGEIVVADDGPGIAPENRQRVQERFVRLDNARTRPGGGLGLAMVAAVARLHRGALDLRDPEPGLAAGSGESGLAAALFIPG